MEKTINKYGILLNGSVMVSCLAENEAQAIERAKHLFGNKETYELLTTKFSHVVGEYSINTQKVKQVIIKQEKSSTVLPKKKGDLLTNVMDTIAKDRKIDL